MELVASARLRRAQTRIEAMRPYAETMRELIAGVRPRERILSVRGLPLLQQRDEIGTVSIVALTKDDRGLAGPFRRPDHQARLRGERQLKRKGRRSASLRSARRAARPSPSAATRAARRYVGFTDRPAYADAQAIAHRVLELYVEGAIDRAVLVYNAYVSPLVQTVTEQDLLPISADILQTDEEERRDDAMRGDFIFEPEPEEILARLLPVYYRDAGLPGPVESAASEQGARMMSSDAERVQERQELIDSLTLQMNRARQAEITQEILEIVAGASSRRSTKTSARTC